MTGRRNRRNAGSVLDACGGDRKACPASVDPDEVPVRDAPRWLRLMLPDPFVAITTPWAVYVRPSLFRRPAEQLAQTIIHELIHVDQWRRLGIVGFLRSYLADYVRGRRDGLGHLDAYRRIGLEAEARHRAGEA